MADAAAVRTLFVNSGILGLKTFARFIERAFDHDRASGVDATQIVLTDDLTLRDRVIRKALCARLWPDALIARNLDFFRYRAEVNAGLTARRRIGALEAAGRRFDVLHFHRQAAAYASLDRMRRTPAIVSIDCTQRPVLDSARSALEARTYAPNVRRDGEIFRAARLIVSTSEWAVNCMRREYPDCTTPAMVLPNPVQIDLFDPAWIEERFAGAARRRGKPRVLFVGGDFPRKGGFDLLAAWRDGHFADRAELDIATAWPLDRSLLPPGVVIHDKVTVHSPEWRELWRQADLFAMPTRDEAFGLVFQEAGAAGLPAIGSTINAVPEIVANGESGVLIAPGDRHALAAALDRLIASPTLRREMGRHARQRISVTADPGAYRQKLIAAIRSVAGK